MTNFTGLPEKQAQCLHLIIRHIDETGISPTYPELAQAMGCTPQNVKGIVDELVTKGRLTRDANKHRSIQVVEKKGFVKV